jgi:hypothetical protein
MKVLITSLGLFAMITASAFPGRSADEKYASLPRDTTVVFVERISNIDFHDQQYEIAFWLQVHWKGKVPLSEFTEQLQVWGAKKTTITAFTVLPGTNADVCNLKLKISCLMQQEWVISGYPFDGQCLKIFVYNALLDTSQFSFGSFGHSHLLRIPSDTAYASDTTLVFEDGWHAHEDTVIAGLSGHQHRSGLTLKLDLDRSSQWSIFFKLFVGMYVAFFVAWMAFFIDPDRVEPRFGLPLGALFAAVGNKYIVESFLPQSPGLSIVDWLHAVTFLMILAIMAFSAYLLTCQQLHTKQASDPKIRKLNTWKRKNRIGSIVVLAIYLGFNLIVILITKVYHQTHPC